MCGGVIVNFVGTFNEVEGGGTGTFIWSDVVFVVCM